MEQRIAEKTQALDAAFKALASEQRREILRILAAEERAAALGEEKTCCEPHEVCGCKLSERLGLVASTISHHMSVLRAAGLVSSRKEGQWVYYRLERDRISDVVHELVEL
jgi:ArsR family transcriptional regulator, arsenate/arsenite/antimonite-responsive transcriptional repressor